MKLTQQEIQKLIEDYSETSDLLKEQDECAKDAFQKTQVANMEACKQLRMLLYYTNKLAEITMWPKEKEALHEYADRIRSKVDALVILTEDEDLVLSDFWNEETIHD